jgi:biotin carboxylase
MNLSGKTLLVLSGSNGASDIVEYANANGAKTVATDYLKESPAKLLADYSHDVSTTDINGIIDLARKYSVDGITTGTSEASMFTILQVAKILNLPFYATDTQLERINNKRKFKEILVSHGVPVIPDHATRNIDGSIDLNSIKLPAVIKPVDSCGAKGISIVRNHQSIDSAISHALSYSRVKDLVVEKLIDGLSETFINYTIIDGNYSISSSFDIHRHPKKENDELVSLPLLYSAPSKHLDHFIQRVHPNLCNVFKELGLKNGVISIQSFAADESFFVYEAGYRLGGAQMYIFTKKLNNISALEMMVNFSIFGRMSDDSNILKRDQPKFKQPCCQLNIALQPGTIAKIDGVDLVNQMEEVLNVTQNHFVGDIINSDGSLRQLAFRIHLTANDQTSLYESSRNIFRKLCVLNNKGEDMLMGFDHIQKEWF